MRKLSLTIFFLLLVFITTAQTQREQEDRTTIRLFKEKYQKETYAKFSGNIITIDDNTLKFDGITLRVFVTKEEMLIFKLGLLYPQLLSWDDISIENFEELKFIETPLSSRRYRFWLFRKGFANPVVYLIELTNISADKNTDLPAFIKGATLTFIQPGWVII